MTNERAIFLLLNGVEYELDEVVTDDVITSRRQRLENLIANGGRLQRFRVRTANGRGELLVRPEEITAAAIIVGAKRGAGPASPRRAGGTADSTVGSLHF